MSSSSRSKRVGTSERKLSVIRKGIEPPFFEFELFVAGDAPNSALALSNLVAFCNSHLRNRHRIEIVNIYDNPARALIEGVLLTPTLLRRSPSPHTRVVGTLDNSQTLMNSVGVGVL